MEEFKPLKLTPEVRKKLEEAAALDATWAECALYASIGMSTLFSWFDEVKGLRDELEILRKRPTLKARTTVVNSLDDPNLAFRYLERKRRKEFGPIMDLTSDGEKLDFKLKSDAELTQFIEAGIGGIGEEGTGATSSDPVRSV